ncbi:MAG: cytochrome P450 [Caldilineaceae bacterium]|nr:cytochrome P450 [Caldilineaceae bacterium]
MQQSASVPPPVVPVPPSPTGVPILGNLLQVLRKEPLHYYIDLWQTYGDLVRLKMGNLNGYLVAHPAYVHHILVKNQKNYIKGRGYDGFRLLVGQGLVTSEGELWQQQRRLMQPSFTPNAINGYTALMVDVIDRLLARWQTLAAAGTTVNIDDEMMRLTMSIIGKAMFSIDLSEELTEVGEAFHTAFAFIPDRTMTPFALPLAVPLPSHRRFQHAMQVINDFITERIAEGRQSQGAHNLLAVLLRAQDEETGRGMSEQQLRDEVITLFFAGFETTARSLTWGWYLITRHPLVQQKLEAEVDTKLALRAPGIGELYQLPYTRMVVDETLRLYPPTAMLARQNREDDQLGDYPIPAGSMILPSPFLVHRHPDFWPDAERFDPERFSPEQAESRPKYAYIPFANGPRICIGNNFALLEMVLAIAMITARYRLQPLDPSPIGFTLRGTIQPDRPLLVQLEARA